MCGRCSRYLGLRRSDCLFVFHVFSVDYLVVLFCFCFSFSVARLWMSVFVVFSVCILRSVECLKVLLGVAVIQSIFVCITSLFVCVCRGSFTGFGQSRGDSCIDGLQ